MTIDTRWRWTSAPIRAGGLHGSILLFFPALIATGLSRYTFLAFGLYTGFLVYCRLKDLTPGQMLRHWRARHLDRGQWPAS